VHLYNSTSELQRRVVFGKSKQEILDLAVQGTLWVKREAERLPGTEVIFQYSPESFTGTELDYALEVCDAVVEAWDAGPERPMILNLPTTVEMTTPNVFADRIEWFDRHRRRREHVTLSVHTHNDRGTGVASAELALLAGATRVEGTLLGNGERSGNVDIVTLAMNLYSHGVDPMLYFEDMPEVVRVVEEATRLPVHPRHPYAGQLVFTAFSGSHQDAIHKGMKHLEQTDGSRYEVPYLPIDPADVGRAYEPVIRINSQSGKGGMAYLLERDHGLRMPRRMQVEFSAVVQRAADASEAEVAAEALWALFGRTYLAPSVGGQALRIVACEVDERDGVTVDIGVAHGERRWRTRGHGATLADAAVQALAPSLRLDSQLLDGAPGQARWALIELSATGQTCFGAARDDDIAAAIAAAVLSAAARLGAVSIPEDADRGYAQCASLT